MPKIIRTYSVDNKLYEWFDKYSKDVSLNKSGFISKKIEELKQETEQKTKTNQQEKS